MALFSSKKNTAKTSASADVRPTPSKASREVVKKVPLKARITARDLSHVLQKPRITEKASHVSESNVYVFDVRRDVTAHDVKAAIIVLYKETPVKVNVLPVPKKAIFFKGKHGVKSGGKKAYVYFKKGVKIEII